MAQFGLIGKDIDYSFSRTYFKEKFKIENRKDTYINFDLSSIAKFKEILAQNPKLKGLNVTIPYKEAIVPYLDKIDKKASVIGAVNTIKIKKNGKLVGYNTDCYGFKKALQKFYIPEKTALILGTGGASKAIAYVLKKQGFQFQFVSRTLSEKTITYQELSEKTFKNHFLIINCTPLGTFPNIKDCPPIPYKSITQKHLLFDLIYNPAITTFLKKGISQGAQTTNGLSMLVLQAEKSWEIWNT